MSPQIEACSLEVEAREAASDSLLNLTSAPAAKSLRQIGPRGENLIFLISQPRAGSTLLQRILAGHDEVFATAEPWIMLHPLHALKRSGYEADYNAEWARNALSDFCQSLPGGEEDYVEALRGMAVGLYNKALQASGKSHFLDKTPRYYGICPELRRTFPGAHFVFLVRNPLAVLASIIQSWTKEDWRKMDDFRRDLLEAPGLLAAAIKDFGADAIVVRYEELAADPEGVVGRLCGELGLDFHAGMLEYGSREKPRGSMGDQIGVNAHQQTVTSSVAKWRQTLAGPEVKYFAFRYAAALRPEVLSALGYPIETLLANVVSIPGAPLGADLTNEWLQRTNEFFAQSAGEAKISENLPAPVPARETVAKVVTLPAKLAVPAVPSEGLSGVAAALKEMADKRLGRGDATGAKEVLTKALRAAPKHPVLVAAIAAIEAHLGKEGQGGTQNDKVVVLKKTRPSRAELLRRYEGMFPRVEGWLQWEAVQILDFLNSAQIAEGVVGNFAEIGAYQGKLTLGMAAFLQPEKELLIVNDIFDLQDLNTSRSGIGATLAAFNRNLHELDCDPHYLRVIMKRSDAVSPAEFGPKVRFFSVDGGHSAEETRGDMRLAAQTLHDQGMIVLDDFFNTNWPGVAEGVKIYFEAQADLAPLLAFYNKFVFVKRQALPWFQRLLATHHFAAYCQAENFNVTQQSLHGFDYTMITHRTVPAAKG